METTAAYTERHAKTTPRMPMVNSTMKMFQSTEGSTVETTSEYTEHPIVEATPGSRMVDLTTQKITLRRERVTVEPMVGPSQTSGSMEETTERFEFSTSELTVYY